MYFQEVTPDTSGYMIAGYAIAFLVMGLYVVSLLLRNRNLKKDLEMLEEMDKPVIPPERTEPNRGKKRISETKKTVTKRGQKKRS